MPNKHEICWARHVMPPIQRHSPLSHTAYVDLLSSLKEETISGLRGTPVLKRRGGKSFWYDSYRVGRSVKTSYIGPDTDEVRDRLKRIEAIRSDEEQRMAGRRRSVRILRAEGFLSLDAATGSLVSAMAAAGAFRLGGTIVGTHAFRLYEGELGLRMSIDQAASTSDVDIASSEAHFRGPDETHVKGFSTAAPRPATSASFRVTSVKPWTLAVAARSPSVTGTGRMAFRHPHSSAIAVSIGSARSPKASVMVSSQVSSACAC